MSIDRGVWSGDANRGRIKTAGSKFQHCVDLLPRDIELLDDFLNTRTGLKIFKDGSHGHPCIAKHPCSAHPPRHAFHSGALGPIESCHVPPSFPLKLFTTGWGPRHARKKRSFRPPAPAPRGDVLDAARVARLKGVP